MPEKAKEPEGGSKSAESVMSAMSELQKLGFGSMAWMGTAWLENLSDFGSEVLNFVADRVREDVKTQHAILHCKNPTELQHIQAEFIQKAVDQYASETGKLVEMSNELITKAQKSS